MVATTHSWKWCNFSYFSTAFKEKLIPKTIGNRKRDCAWGGSGWWTLPEKIYRSQSTNQSAKPNERLPDLCFAICRFSRFITPSHLTHNLFIGLGKIWSFVLGFRSLVARLVPFERGGTKTEGEKIFGNGKCELIANFSATMVTSPRRERREVWREKRKVRIFGKGKCKLITNCANFWQGKV